MSKPDHDTESFLARWSRRKNAQQQAAASDEQAASEADSPVAEVAPSPQQLPDELKDFSPDDLDVATTDFSRFMHDDIPEDIRRQALRKLWESDELLANLDGLNDYDEDFTPQGMLAAAKGFLQRVADTMSEDSRTISRKSSPSRESVDEEKTAETLRSETPEKEGGSPRLRTHKMDCPWWE